MKALLPLLIVLLLSASLVSAQETPEATDWTTVQRCITAPSQPPEGWTYDGVIFTYKPGDGVHARRADVATPYYVAFDGNTEFAGAGRLSPDGKWFAVPVGYIPFHTDIDKTFVGTAVRVYSTSPDHEMYQVAIRRRDTTINTKAMTPIFWVDNQHFITQGLPDGYFDGNQPFLIDPFEGTATVIDLPPGAEAVSGIGSPVGRHTPVLASDSAYSAAMLVAGQSFGIFDQDGNIVETIPTSWVIWFAYSGEKLAFVNNGSTIQIADLSTHTITDTCIKPQFSIAFSPDGRQLAFVLRSAGYTYILDIPAWQAYRIDLAAADVIGWYPLE